MNNFLNGLKLVPNKQEVDYEIGDPVLILKILSLVILTNQVFEFPKVVVEEQLLIQYLYLFVEPLFVDIP